MRGDFGCPWASSSPWALDVPQHPSLHPWGHIYIYIWQDAVGTGFSSGKSYKSAFAGVEVRSGLEGAIDRQGTSRSLCLKIDGLSNDLYLSAS